MLVLSCIFGGAAQGILISCAGLFIQPVCNALGFGTGPFSTYLAIGAVFLLIGFPLAGKVMAKFPIKPLLVVCIVINCGGFMLYSQFTHLWMFYASGLFMGLSSVIPAYMISPLLVSNWFDSNQGMAMGISRALSAMIGAVFSIIGGVIIETLGYQAGYLILGATALVMMLPCAFMVVMSPEVLGLQPYRTKEESTKHEGAPVETTGVSASAALKSLPFIFMFATVFFMVCGGAFAPQIAGLVPALGYNMAQAGTFVSIFMVGSVLGSFVLGFLNDKLGVRNTMYVILAMGIGSILLLTIGAPVSTLLLILGLLCFGMFSAAGGVQPPLIISNMFGQKDYATIFGVMQMSMSLAGIFATPVYGFILDTTGSFNMGLYGLAALLVIGVVLTYISFKTYKRLWVNTSAPV
ncbi:MAG: MFS transporter [Oscillibacter sp.]